VKEYAVHPDPARLAAYGVGLVQLVEALEHANRIAGAGYVNRAGEAYIVRADARIRSLEELAQTPILNRGGQVIRVSDVAMVEIGRAPRLGSASSNGRETVVGTALMLQGENSRAVAHRVGERLKEIGASLPPGVVVKPALDRTQLVEATIRTVEHNLALGALLVIAVLFFALGNVRAAIITALVIPLSFLFAAPRGRSPPARCRPQRRRDGGKARGSEDETSAAPVVGCGKGDLHGPAREHVPGCGRGSRGRCLGQGRAGRSDGGGRERRRQIQGDRRLFHSGHIAVAEPPPGIAGVVAGQGDAQGGLAMRRSLAGRPVARAEDRRRGAEI